MRGRTIVLLGLVSAITIPLGAVFTASAGPPVVSNVRAAQRTGTGLVDILYDVSGPVRAAAAALAGMVEGAKFLREVGRIAGFRVLLGGRWITLAGLDAKGPGDL